MRTRTERPERLDGGILWPVCFFLNKAGFSSGASCRIYTRCSKVFGRPLFGHFAVIENVKIR